MSKKKDQDKMIVTSVTFRDNTAWKYGADQVKDAEEKWRKMSDPSEYLKVTELDRKSNLPPDVPPKRNRTSKNQSQSVDSKRHEFSTSVRDIIRLVSEGKLVEGIDLIDKMQDSFQFRTTVDPSLGEKLSDAFTAIAKANRAKAGKKGSVKSSKARNDSANKYAAKMFTVIEDMKKQSSVFTVRATVDLLNKNNVETPNGGKWRINTLQSLERRWKDLGLTTEKPNPK